MHVSCPGLWNLTPQLWAPSDQRAWWVSETVCRHTLEERTAGLSVVSEITVGSMLKYVSMAQETDPRPNSLH